jgi:hypothetical protein
MANYFEMSRKELAAEKAKLEDRVMEARLKNEVIDVTLQTRPSPDGSGYGTFADDGLHY